MNKKLLIVFVKNPEKGKVKTRLAKTVGNEKAYQTYLKLLKFTIHVAEDVQAHKQIWYSSFIDHEDGLGGPEFDKMVQKGGDLGERMLHAFEKGFQESFEKIVIIGSDCPEITPQIIGDAFELLDEIKVVVGPSEDGGYYLLGLKRLIPEIFKDISWSSSKVLSETFDILKNQDIDYDLLPTLNDIDTVEDLRKSSLE